MKRFTSALILVVVFLLVLGPASAVAAPVDKKTTVLNVDTCVPLNGGETVCITSKGMIHQTVTPSGNESYVTNYRERILVIQDDQTVWDETSDERFHSLTMDGVLQELSSRSQFTLTTVGQPFCVEYHLHGANGVDQFVRVDFC